MNQAGASKSMEKLSSGFRINRAGDDAAGLAISEKMRGQIRGLKQASRNAQDGISLIQTAEGSLNETHSILQRMRELAVQASNGTSTDNDRAEIQKEVSQLVDEIDRISNTTEFNTKKLLNGKAGVQGSVTAGSTIGQFIGGTEKTLEGTYVITIDTDAASKATRAAGSDIGTVNNFSSKDYSINGIQINVADLDDSNVAGLATRINEYTAQTGVEASASATQITLTQVNYGSKHSITIAGDDSAELGGTLTAGKDVRVDITTADGTTADVADLVGDGQMVTIPDGYDGAGLTVKVTGTANNESFTVNVTQGSLSFQIGANEGQDMSLAINEMSTSKLGDVEAGNYIRDIDLSTQGGAKAATSVINKAIDQVSAERSKLGAVQNRLEHTIANLGTSAENLQAAESRIRDLDMAEEIMAFTKNNILQQAATAMLAQANMAPQSVLQLLG